MQRDGRAKGLEAFGRGPAILAEALRKCPRKMWLYRPAQNLWSIHEIILHLADSEAEGYIRCRQFIAEPGSAAQVYDAATWASSLGYFHQSTKEALGLITRLRRMTHRILLYIPEPVWSHSVRHPKKGALTLDEWLEIQARHIPHHVEQIQQSHVAWAQTHPPRKPASRISRTKVESQPTLGPLAQISEFGD
ncbi:MAG TPA: DinB family protein [Candidatus Acidoferrales bacterium]|nr:DinB family protein [Candidatus Acidoferrales bacterium]